MAYCHSAGYWYAVKVERETVNVTEEKVSELNEYLEFSIQKVDFDQVYVHYGEFQNSIFIECAVLKISANAIPWEYFSQPDVLHKNLQRYANWNLNKYRKL